MKKIIMYFLLLSGIVAGAQTEEDKAQLKQDVRNLMTAYNESNYKEAIKYMPDFVFEDVPREEVLAQISNIPPHVAYEIKEVKVDTIIKVDGPTYGIKTATNDNWTFIDLNEMTEKHLPAEIIKPSKE